MKTIEIKGFVHCKPAEGYHVNNVVNGLKYSFWDWEDMSSQGFALVSPASITIEITEDFNPNTQFAAALEAGRKYINSLDLGAGA